MCNAYTCSMLFQIITRHCVSTENCVDYYGENATNITNPNATSPVIEFWEWVHFLFFYFFSTSSSCTDMFINLYMRLHALFVCVNSHWGAYYDDGFHFWGYKSIYGIAARPMTPWGNSLSLQAVYKVSRQPLMSFTTKMLKIWTSDSSRLFHWPPP